MDKRKNGVRQKKRLTKWGLFAIFMIGAALISFALLKTGGVCLAVDTADFVMYGLDGNRDQRTESAAVLDALAGLHLKQVDGLPDAVQKHMDMALYDDFTLLGTLLFYHAPDMGTWYVQINDAGRNDCGRYRVEQAGVERLFDGLRAD